MEAGAQGGEEVTCFPAPMTRILPLLLAGIALLLSSPAPANARPFGEREAAYYQAALAYWGAAPKCLQVESHVRLSGAFGGNMGMADIGGCTIWLAEEVADNARLACRIVVHEVGHMLGHDHSSSPLDLMHEYAVYDDGVSVTLCESPPATAPTPTWPRVWRQIRLQERRLKVRRGKCRASSRKVGGKRCWRLIRSTNRKLERRRAGVLRSGVWNPVFTTVDVVGY